MAASREQIEALIAALEQQGPGHLAEFLGGQAYGNLQGSAVRRPHKNVFALMRENPERFAALVEQVRPGYFNRQDSETRAGTGTINLQYAPQNPRPPTQSQAASGLEMKLGDFILQKELGRGAMGVVYLAQDARLDRQVALKLLPALSGDDLLRFVQEGRSMGQLKPHPNIVQVYTSGSDQGKHYLAMELVDNARKLGDVLPSLPSETNRWLATARLLEQVTKGVAYAHEHRVIHRDLKPDNILVAADGTPKVADFGLAKSTNKPGNLTQEGDIVGTPGYMAPEQFEGNRSLVGPHSDVYSLGAIIYEALTLRKPYHFTSMADIALELKELDRLPRKPTELVPNVPLELERIAMKALNKRVEKRYRNAGELLTDISAYVTEQELSEAERERLDELRKAKAAATESQQKRRRNTIVGILGTAVLAAVSGLAVVSLDYRAQGAELQTTREREGRVAAEAAAAKTRMDAEIERQKGQYEFHITQAREAANAGRLEEAGRHMRTARSLHANDRRPEITSLENFINGDRTVTIAPINSNGIYWQISEMTRNGEVPVTNSRSTGPQNVTLKHGHFYNLEAAPEGKMEYRHLFRMDAQTRIPLRAEPLIQGQVVIDGRARPLPEFYLIANDSRDFYFSAVPTSIGQYVLFLQDRGIDIRDRSNELRPAFVSNSQSLPLTQINVRQAQAYCDWLTEKIAANGFNNYRARLPTPAEVELAAAPHSGRTYPWGYDVNPTNNDGTITNVYDAATLQRALEGNTVASLLRPLTISDNLLGVAASRAKHWGNVRRLAVDDGQVYAVGASFMENDPTLHQFRRDNQGAWLYRRQLTENQPDAATGFSPVIEKIR